MEEIKCMDSLEERISRDWSTFTPTRWAMPHFCGLPAIRFVARSLRGPTPAKAACGTHAWAQRRRQPWTTDGAEGRPRTHFQSRAYPIWDLKGYLKGRKAGARVRAE